MPFVPTRFMRELWCAHDKPFIVSLIHRLEEAAKMYRTVCGWKLRDKDARIVRSYFDKRQSDRFVAADVVAQSEPSGHSAERLMESKHAIYWASIIVHHRVCR